MSVKELEEATKKYDKPFNFEDTRPLTAKERVLFEVARGNRRAAIRIVEAATRETKIEEGAKRSQRRRKVTLALNEATVRRCEEYAARHRLTLSEVVNLGLSTAFRFAD